MEGKTPGQVAYEAQPDAAKKIPWNHLLPKKRGEWEVIAHAVISANAAVRQMPHMPGARLRTGNTGAPIGCTSSHREQFMSKPVLDRRDFHGALLLTEFIPTPQGGNVRGLIGTVNVLSAVEALGFDVNDRDSNWCVTVAGPTLRIVVPGCKVHSIFTLPAELAMVGNSDYWTLP